MILHATAPAAPWAYVLTVATVLVVLLLLAARATR